MKKPKITELLIFIVATELVGALSGLLAGNSFSFYKELIKPPLSPPGWLFPADTLHQHGEQPFTALQRGVDRLGAAEKRRPGGPCAAGGRIVGRSRRKWNNSLAWESGMW